MWNLSRLSTALEIFAKFFRATFWRTWYFPMWVKEVRLTNNVLINLLTGYGEKPLSQTFCLLVPCLIVHFFKACFVPFTRIILFPYVITFVSDFVSCCSVLVVSNSNSTTDWLERLVSKMTECINVNVKPYSLTRISRMCSIFVLYI